MAVVLALPAAAAAGRGSGAGDEPTSAPAPALTAPATVPGGVPFTGLDLALMVGGGVGLIGAGAGMRRMSGARA